LTPRPKKKIETILLIRLIVNEFLRIRLACSLDNIVRCRQRFVILIIHWRACMSLVSRILILTALLASMVAIHAQAVPMPVLSRNTNPELASFAEGVDRQPVAFVPTMVRGYLKGNAVPADVTKEPFIYAGRLESSIGSCSAQLVAHATMVLTAAHCVYDNKRNVWANNIKFVRGYGGPAAKTHSVQCVGVPKQWTNQKLYSADYAWIRINEAGPAYLGIVHGLIVPKTASLLHGCNGCKYDD
jgi:hypothetical protein